ncbi:MAG: nucleotidyl transferase AbiEii/AbiGii toxin family protein [Planctomycetia bacterium]
MADRDDALIKLHEDVPLFREALAFTAAKTGFNAPVIEKDYFGTVLLWDFTHHGGADLIFKGGTCLAKVHVGFYRLSEDLDFAIPMPVDASRGERSRAADAIKQAVAGVSQRLSGFSCAAELKGANDSAQYSGVVTYRSVLSNEPQVILIDVSVREPMLTPPATLSAQTVLMDPISGQSAVPGLEVTCINALEAMAEKFRAALSRRDVAIRDFYDLDYAVRKLSLELGNASFGDMVRRKLAIPGTPPVDVGSERMATLRRQVDAKLKPVLREEEFRDFDLDRAIALVVDMATRVA